jgi:DNA polymerase-3 subunit chi
MDISFYQLSTFPLDKALPKLLEKVYASGARALILTASEAAAVELGNLLWSYREDSFLPHGTSQDKFPAEQPLYITSGNENPAAAAIVIGTQGAEPVSLDGIERYLDMFDGNDDAQLTLARARWKKYKNEGHAMTYWQQNSKGGWDKVQ